MTPIPEPALFVEDTATGRFIPANRVATTLAAQASKMYLTLGDIARIKARGYRVLRTNGEEISTGVTA